MDSYLQICIDIFYDVQVFGLSLVNLSYYLLLACN